MTSFDGKVAFITGAANGIGLAIARAVAARGARLAITDVQPAPLAAARRTLEEAGADVLAIPLDVADRTAFYAAADRTEAHFGRIHLAFNNAGVGHVGVSVDRVPDETHNWVVGVNLLGVIHGIKALVPKLTRHGEGGYIVNTSSMAGLTMMPGWSQGLYAATKMGVLALTLDLREAMAPHGIGVSAFCPGLVETEIARTAQQLQPEANRAVPATIPNELVTGAMPAVEAAERLLRGMAAERPIIVTHPELWPAVAAFHAMIGDAFKAAEPAV